jgi:hypothetical protein
LPATAQNLAKNSAEVAAHQQANANDDNDTDTDQTNAALANTAHATEPAAPRHSAEAA